MFEKLALLYVITVGLGHFVTLYWSKFLHHQWGNKDEDRIWQIPALVGAFERALITTLVVWMPIAAGAFLATWFLAKGFGGWGKLMPGENKNENKKQRSIYMIGLLGGLMSALWTLGWAIYFFPPVKLV